MSRRREAMPDLFAGIPEHEHQWDPAPLVGMRKYRCTVCGRLGARRSGGAIVEYKSLHEAGRSEEYASFSRGR